MNNSFSLNHGHHYQHVPVVPNTIYPVTQQQVVQVPGQTFSLLRANNPHSISISEPQRVLAAPCQPIEYMLGQSSCPSISAASSLSPRHNIQQQHHRLDQQQPTPPIASHHSINTNAMPVDAQEFYGTHKSSSLVRVPNGQKALLRSPGSLYSNRLNAGTFPVFVKTGSMIKSPVNMKASFFHGQHQNETRVQIAKPRVLAIPKQPVLTKTSSNQSFARYPTEIFGTPIQFTPQRSDGGRFASSGVSTNLMGNSTSNISRLAQGQLTTQEVQFSNHAQSPAAAIQTVRGQLERKRKSEPPQTANSVSSSSVSTSAASATKLSRKVLPLKAPTPNMVRSIERARKEKELRPVKEKLKAASTAAAVPKKEEVVCLSSDEEEKEAEEESNCMIRVSSVNGFDNEAVNGGFANDGFQPLDENGEAVTSYHCADSTMESESNSSCSLQCVKSSVVEQSATNEGNLPNMKNYPTLAQLKRDPNSLEMSPFSVALTSIYYNNGLVCPTKTELQCKFSKLEIVLPDSSCFVHPAEVPRRISFNSIQGAHYMLSSAFNGLLIHLSSNPLPANQQTVASLDQAQQNVASKESTSGQYLLLILKSPLKLELVQRLKLLFEYLNFIRNTISFIRDDRAAVFNFYKEWETDKTKLARCSSGIGASSAANSALVKAFNNSGNAARNGNTVTLYTYTRDKTIIPITSADVRCLNPDEFLNDTIIDFYCNWLLDRYLTEPEQRNRVYLFNSFFYKTYTQVKNPPKPTASEVASGKGGAVAVKVKRHERVKKWTKNVNLFEKDFIIIPVNEEWHWFLVLICFPKQAINASAHNALMASQKSQTVGNWINASKIAREREPLILVLNSLITGNKNNLFKQMRDYLEVELLDKSQLVQSFSRTAFAHMQPSVPQQTNSFDCGIYLFKYLEKFLQDFVTIENNPKEPDKKIEWEKWFETSETSNMRNELKTLIASLHDQKTVSNFEQYSFKKVVSST